MSSPCYQWPAAGSPEYHLPAVEDRLTGQDQGVIFWVPLDYLHGRHPTSGYWQFTTAQGYRTGGAGEPTVYLGGPDRHVLDLAAAVAAVLPRGLPRLTAVLRQVTTGGGSCRRAGFPAFIVH